MAIKIQPAASGIPFTPNGSIASTNVQAAIQEVRDEAVGGGGSFSLGSNFANVRDSGATGDGTTDDSTAIQSAIDSLDPNRGGIVYFPEGIYRIATGLTIPYAGTWLVGQGQPGTSADVANGSTRIISDNGITAITANPGATPVHSTLGFGFAHLHVRAATGATSGNGILIQNSEKTIIQHVTCSGYTAGAGLQIGSGATGNSQYAELFNYSAGDCAKGLYLIGAAPNSCTLYGGYFEGSTSPAAGSIGIFNDTGDGLRVYGTKIQGYDTGIYIDSDAAGQVLFGPRLEYCNIGLRIGATARTVQLFGGSFNNNLLGGTGTGIQVDAGATNTVLLPGNIEAVASRIVDNGTDTLLWGNFGSQPYMFLPGSLGVGGAIATHLGTGDGVLAFKDAATAPSTDPTGGGALWTSAGDLKFKGSGKSTITLGAGGGGSLSSDSDVLASDVTMTSASTWYDGAAVTLAAGTWLLTSSIYLSASTAATRGWSARIYDGAAPVASGGYEVVAAGAAGFTTLAYTALVSPATSTTYTLQAQSSLTNDLIKGGVGRTQIVAVKIA